VIPGNAVLLLSGGAVDVYFGSLSGPDNFGSGGVTFADNFSGPVVFINGRGVPDVVGVPSGYTSDSALGPSSDIFDNTNFAVLGITPGTYVWTWGSGADQSFTLEIEAPTATPLPAALPLFATGLGGLGLLSWRRKRKA